MTVRASILFLVAVTIISCVLTGIIRLYAMKRLMDVANERSMHKSPTPRGGGGAIVLATITASCIAWKLGWMAQPLALSITVGGLMVAGIGWMDDHGHVSSGLRAAIHFGASIFALWQFGWLHEIDFGFYRAPLGIFSNVIALVIMVWFVNMYNFMDGIDGLAGSEAVFVGIGGGALLWMGGNSSMGIAAFIIGAASLGFLAWNWPPAKIFMGDVGSGFLGLMFAILLVGTASEGKISFWLWFILIGVFLTDTSYTLIKRIRTGQKATEPHSTHTFQKASKSVGSHLPVTLSAICINMLWLAPIATICYYLPRLSVGLTFLAALPLFFLARKYRAGVNETK
ncbi:MAG: glycosyltransferase family 4 protein [Chthonomonadales bacterium]